MDKDSWTQKKRTIWDTLLWWNRDSEKINSFQKLQACNSFNQSAQGKGEFYSQGFKFQEEHGLHSSRALNKLLHQFILYNPTVLIIHSSDTVNAICCCECLTMNHSSDLTLSFIYLNWWLRGSFSSGKR